MTPIQQIKAAIHCGEYIGRFIDVRRGKAICPFHKEKTASLQVHDDYFKCHGCGIGGDVIKFAVAYHAISTGDAIRMLADELNIPLTREAAVHPYDAIKAKRIHDEAMEWRRLIRLQMVNAPDYETSIPFLEDLDSMTRQQILTAYQEQRTVAQAAMLRASIRDTDTWEKAFTPLLKKYIEYLGAMTEVEFEEWTFSSWVGVA